VIRPATATLAGLPPGSRVIVREIHAEPDFGGRLMDLGLVPGTVVHVVRRAPLGDPLELIVRGAHFSIRHSEAEHIHVDLL
jgi:ferrous iron transport protein A